ncbi:MAG: pyruvate:ferredoxin (flavodoxin) oxidoreductase [Acidimicrobiales bacterium]|nr:pyruvate:ferredoxin (flavodoxin) oxidoreductase [Acidimicrobiales bacterium]
MTVTTESPETATTPDGSSAVTAPRWATVDGNEAAALVAYALSEVVAIYPITPASPMGESADAWSAAGQPNLWGAVPTVVEMQSEAGAAGTLHGAAMKGALATTFTSSQGLLLMLPNMYKLAGELLPTVIHVAARAIAGHALSIFGDHSDAMAARTTGFAQLCSSSVQEAHDFAAVAHACALENRVPFLHFFDGFRTSHEVNRIQLLSDDDLRAMIDPAWIEAHRAQGLSPERPVLRGSAQNPDVFFQAREAANAWHDAVPAVVTRAFENLAARTGRHYDLVEYHGAPDAERVVVLMGSGVGAATEAVDRLVAEGEKVGLLTIRLYRPFPSAALLAALPDTVSRISVLDRVKEPGAVGEPLYTDVVTALAEAVASGERVSMPRVVGGRYGLASKEFTPAMVKAVLDDAGAERPRNHFTVGIVDDVTHTSLAYDPTWNTETAEVRAVFFGLGSDGTVSANKGAVKIVGEQAERYAQGYFVYDSKKSGSVTVSHLRFSDEPITSTYLVQQAGFVACHQFNLLERLDVLAYAEPGATFLLNAPYPPDEVWDNLPREVQEQLIAKQIRLFVIDGYRVAREVGMGNRINAVMMPPFFALSGILPREEAVGHIKASFEKAYGRRGRAVVERNNAAVDRALEEVHEVALPAAVSATRGRRPAVPEGSPDFVERVTARMLAGEGDLLPVSALTPGGVFPTATAQYEKRELALEIPVWDPDICIDCGKCALVCPHQTIRMKVFDPAELTRLEGEGALPDDFLSKGFRSKDLSGMRLTIQVAPDDCTGCGVCVDVCPARSKEVARHKAINMEPVEDHRDVERARWDAFLALDEVPRDALGHDSVKGAARLEPLFEFSGACSGCGETPYLSLLTRLFGDRTVIGNATGCSSIYGGNLPTTPYTTNDAGRGPAWANSLFEDNAEFGLGLRLAHDQAAILAAQLVRSLASEIGDALVDDLLGADQSTEPGIDAQRDRVALLRVRLADLTARGGPVGERAAMLSGVVGDLVRQSIWIVGGDGWAYDIGFSGLDHVLASGRNVNLLVLDTEVYSNTGGQASKATPRGAVAKFATGGKPTPKKDLGMIAMAYGNVYVAQVAMGGNDVQTVKAFTEAEAWPGPSLIIAYSTCIAHGIEMSTSMTHQKDAVKSGYWPLYRYHPGLGEHEHPFRLDSHDPSIPLADFAKKEGRFAVLARTHPEEASHLLALEQADIDERWRLYRQLAGIERTVAHEPDVLDPDLVGDVASAGVEED